MAIPFQQKFQDADIVVKLAIGAAAVYIIYNIYQVIKNAANNPYPSGAAVASGLNAFLQGIGIEPDPNDTSGDPNSVGDTSSAAYAGNGGLGVLGNAGNKILGGIPQSIGNSIGAFASGSDSYDPNSD